MIIANTVVFNSDICFITEEETTTSVNRSTNIILIVILNLRVQRNPDLARPSILEDWPRSRTVLVSFT